MADEDPSTCETWQRCPGYALYEASTAGRVRRGHRVLKPLVRERRGVKTRGYAQVGVVDDAGVRKTRTVHRLVALAFLGPPHSDRSEVNHINGIKTDNRIENLEWTDHAGNAAHAASIGLVRSGESVNTSKLSEDDVRAAREYRASGCTYVEIGRRFGITDANARLACLGKTWRKVT